MKVKAEARSGTSQPGFTEQMPSAFVPLNFQQVAPLYYERNYFPIPLYGNKGVTATGVTGGTDKLSRDQQLKLHRDHGAAVRVGLRLVDLVGLDVDGYKPGAVQHWLDLLEQYGPLPETWMTSARFELDDYDGVSGIRLFRLPDAFLDAQLEPIWQGNVGPTVDVIRMGHRNANVWPTTHHKLGVRYKWLDQGTGAIVDAPIPVSAEALPLLPARWLAAVVKPPPPPRAEYATVDLSRANADRYLTRTFELMQAEAARVVAMDEGQVDERGRGWERFAADLAYRLVGLAYADWNDLTLDEAEAVYVQVLGPIYHEDAGRTCIGEAKWSHKIRVAPPALQPAALWELDLDAVLDLDLDLDFELDLGEFDE